LTKKLDPINGAVQPMSNKKHYKYAVFLVA